MLGLGAYCAFLLAHWPAAHAWSLAERYLSVPPEVQVGTLDGTVWDGQGIQVGTTDLQAEQIRWRVRPAALLTGRLEATIEASMGDGFAEGRATLAAGGLSLRDVHGRFPAAPWSRLAAQFGEEVLLAGTFAFAIDTLRVDRGGRLQQVDGRLAWHDAAVTVDEYVELGGLTTQLRAEDGALVGELGDTGGPLQLGGGWRLDPAGSYELDAVVDTRDGAADILTRSIEMAGPRREDGVHVGIEGTL
ncbi:type II secretion system protein N [Halorhodospira halophila]|uniref:type II secretion system protein N n=1 Tax=Halorhodospira halophila TaxID=1053 RepID=UPI0002E022BF|nr:type II secretion system protein N [Halorhodospira halophila]